MVITESITLKTIANGVLTIALIYMMNNSLMFLNIMCIACIFVMLWLCVRRRFLELSISTLYILVAYYFNPHIIHIAFYVFTSHRTTDININNDYICKFNLYCFCALTSHLFVRSAMIAVRKRRYGKGDIPN